MIAAERPEFRERFQQLPWPQQLGNLASTLARISGRCLRPEHDALVRDLLREAAVLIEWSAPCVPPEFHLDWPACSGRCWPGGRSGRWRGPGICSPCGLARRPI